MTLPYIQPGYQITDKRNGEQFTVEFVTRKISCLILNTWNDEKGKRDLVINAINLKHFKIEKAGP